MSNRLLLVAGLFALLWSVACSSDKPPADLPKGAGPAPATYRVRFETTKGAFVAEVTRDWAPQGADRFYELVKGRFYDGARFFRVLPGFVVQFGINGDPSISQLWRQLRISDDAVKQSNERGTISFATSGPNSRTTQVFINLADNARLDGMGFAAFGKVTEGMDVVDQFYSGYGEGAPRGNGPEQSKIETQGNSYLESQFPRLDYIKQATIADGK